MNRLILGLSVVFLSVVVGCDSKPAVYEVSGKVTVKGQPAPENSRVNFTPVGSDGEAASGIIDANGNYTLYSGIEGRKGALTGKYKVSFTADASSSDYMDGGRVGGVPGVVLGPFPKEFTSEFTTKLEKEVVKGRNVIDIEVP